LGPKSSRHSSQRYATETQLLHWSRLDSGVIGAKCERQSADHRRLPWRHHPRRFNIVRWERSSRYGEIGLQCLSDFAVRRQLHQYIGEPYRHNEHACQSHQQYSGSLGGSADRKPELLSDLGVHATDRDYLQFLQSAKRLWPLAAECPIDPSRLLSHQGPI